MNHYEPLFFLCVCTEFSDKAISAFLFGEKGQRDIQMIIWAMVKTMEYGCIWAMVNTHYMVDGHPIHNKDPYNGYYKSLWTIGWLAPINGY